MALTIRPARQEDQQTIVSYIRQAKLSSRNLHWERFLVAEENGQIIGIRQVKIHPQGTHEVGSGYVLPEYRRQGVSRHLMNEILSRETGTLYTMINEKRASYYEGFGFRTVDLHQLPSDFRKEFQRRQVVIYARDFFKKVKVRIIPMRRN